jgi:hypothetical protein
MIKEIKTKNFNIEGLRQINLFVGKQNLLDLFIEETKHLSKKVVRYYEINPILNTPYHYSEFDELWDLSFYYCVNADKQLITVTQSLDVIKSFVKTIKLRGLDSVGLFRLEKYEDELSLYLTVKRI